MAFLRVLSDGNQSFFPDSVAGPAAPDLFVGSKSASMGVRPTQLIGDRKNRLTKLFRILTCQMSMSDTHADFFIAMAVAGNLA